MIVVNNKNMKQFVTLCAIWYHVYNFKNVNNTLGGVLLFSKVTDCNLHHVLTFIVQMVPNRATHHILTLKIFE